MTGICEVLDHGDPLRPYTTALAVQSAKLDDVALTPSARLLNELTSTGESFFEQALRMSTFHKEYFLDLYAPNQDRLGRVQRPRRRSPWSVRRSWKRATPSPSRPTSRAILRSDSQFQFLHIFNTLNSLAFET